MNKLISICLLAVSMWALALAAPAQKPVATRLDQDLTVQNEATKIKRFVRFRDALLADADAMGYIIIYGGPGASDIETAAEAARTREYLVEHLRVDTNRVVILVGGNRKTPQKEFWLVPQGADEPRPSPAMPPPAKKVDEYGAVNQETEMAKLDSYVIELQNSPDTKGYIIIYRGRKGHLHDFDINARRIRHYLIKIRGTAPARLIFVSGGSKRKPAYELWIVPPGATPPVPNKEP
jgi:hypothetical protein